MTATWPEAFSRLTRAVALADNSRVVLAGAGGYVTEEALILGDGFSFTNTSIAPNEAAYKGGLAQTRAGLAVAVQNIRTETDAALAEMALALGYSGLSGASALPWVYQSMATNKNSAGAAFSTLHSVVPTRNITRGSSTTTGTGNGVLTRLAIDRYGYPMEADTPEPILMTCRQDVTLGTNPGQESFDCFAAGAPAGDVFQIWTAGYGDGLQAPAGSAIGVTADTSASLGVQNPSFNQSSGSGSGFVLNGWTLSAGSAASMSVSTLTADLYRVCALEGSSPGALMVTFAGATTTVAAGSNSVNVNTFAGSGTLNVASTTGFPTSGALTVNTGSGYVTITYTGVGGTTFTGCTCSGAGVLATGGYVGQNVTTTITQTISSNGGSLEAARAYFSRLACNRSNYTGVGTVTAQVGSRSWSLFLNSQSGYQPLSPPLSSPTDATNGPNLWFPNFDTNSFSVTFSVSIGLGSILLDDFTWGPFSNVANKLLWVGGGSTNFLYGDTITFTDSEPVGGSLVGKTNHWISRLYGVWNLPAATLVATPGSAPTVATGAGSGSVTAGVHYFAISYFDNATGIEGPIGPVSVALYSDGSHHVALTAIPTSGALYRRVYATQANGNPLSLYFVANINDSGTTTYDMNTADGSLTLVAPATADA